MPLFGKSPLSRPSAPWSKPSAPRPSWGLAESLGLRSTPKKEGAAAPQIKSPGLFGEKGYGSFEQQREFVKKAPYESLPGTGQKLGEKERVKLIRELEERAKKSGQTFGLSEQTFRERVLPQMRKEKAQLEATGKINDAIALGRKMQQYEKWIKGA